MTSDKDYKAAMKGGSSWNEVDKKKRKLKIRQRRNEIDSKFKIHSKPDYKRIYSDLNNDLEEYPVYVESGFPRRQGSKIGKQKSTRYCKIIQIRQRDSRAP